MEYYISSFQKISKDLWLLYLSLNLFPVLVSVKYIEQELKYFHVNWMNQHETETKAMIASEFVCRVSWCQVTPVTQQCCHSPLQIILHLHPFQVTCCNVLRLESEKMCNGLLKLEQPTACEGTSSTTGWWPESLFSSEAGNQYLLVAK